MTVSILVCAILLSVLLFAANSGFDKVTLDDSEAAGSKTAFDQAKKIGDPRIVADRFIIDDSRQSGVNLHSENIIRVVNSKGGSVSGKTQEAQLRNNNSSQNMIQNHDNVHPSKYPEEWDSISNKYKICWIHKRTHKKVCERRI